MTNSVNRDIIDIQSGNNINNPVIAMANNQKFVEDLDDLLKNPQKIGKATPKEWYEYLKNNGYNPIPLGGGQLKNILFENGGGFIVRWGGDKIFQYHPKERSHHEGAYWKISSGITGTTWYYLDGTFMKNQGGNK